jgi:23S rRNA-/tRNA-specific pseudouridylate synthase
LNQQNFVVSEDQGGTRLDRWVADELSIGRREAQEWIEQGQVDVNGRRAKKSTLLVVGDTVSVSAPSGERFAVEPDAPLEVVWQCPEALVVHKPAGQPCIPLKRDFVVSPGAWPALRSCEKRVSGQPEARCTV